MSQTSYKVLSRVILKLEIMLTLLRVDIPFIYYMNDNLYLPTRTEGDIAVHPGVSASNPDTGGDQ